MPKSSYRQLQTDLRKLGNSEKAKHSAWFFKTGKGQYGEGDVFVGVTSLNNVRLQSVIYIFL